MSPPGEGAAWGPSRLSGRREPPMGPIPIPDLSPPPIRDLPGMGDHPHSHPRFAGIGPFPIPDLPESGITVAS
jgi:hypothetical protein